MTHRHDVELIEVVFEAVALLIPGHRAFQGRHGVGGVRRIAGFHVDAQGHGAAAGGGEAVFHLLKLASHQGKQIGGFGERVVPNSEVASGVEVAGFDAVAIGEQHRTAGPIGFDPHLKATEQIGAVGVKGDAPKSLGFALGREQPATGVEPFKGAVGFRVDAHPALQLKNPSGRLGDHQLVGAELKGLSRQELAIETQFQQLQVDALEHQRSRLGKRIGHEGQLGQHLGVAGVELHRQIGALKQIRRRTVIGEAHERHGNYLVVLGLGVAGLEVAGFTAGLASGDCLMASCTFAITSAGTSLGQISAAPRTAELIDPLRRSSMLSGLAPTWLITPSCWP